MCARPPARSVKESCGVSAYGASPFSLQFHTGAEPADCRAQEGQLEPPGQQQAEAAIAAAMASNHPSQKKEIDEGFVGIEDKPPGEDMMHPTEKFPFLISKGSKFQSSKSHRALDLFSGSGAVGRHLAQRGFAVTSLDILPSMKPNICVDILQWDYKSYPPHYFRVIAAGVPCNEYSRAKTVGVRDLDAADKIVWRTLEIINYFQPEIWWLENPRTGLLRDRTIVQGIPYVDVDYCQFSDWGYQKPTRIWGPQKMCWLPNKLCDYQTCNSMVQTFNGGWKHVEKLGGYKVKFGTRLKWRMPTTLVDYLLSPYLQKSEVIGEWYIISNGKPKPFANTVSIQGASVPIILPERVLHARNRGHAGQIRSFREALQLILKVDATFENGETKQIWVLIDTGAEANLIRRGVVPDHITYPAKKVLNLIAANGQPIQGGKRTARFNFGLTQFVDGVKLEDKLPLLAELWEADIELDAILSYPWMVENQIGIFPHLKALAKDFPKLTLLFGKGRHVGAIRTEGENCEVIPPCAPQGKSRHHRHLRHRAKFSCKNVQISDVQLQEVHSQTQGLGPKVWNQLQAMDLEVPDSEGEGNFVHPRKLTPSELSVVVNQIGVRKHKINALIEVEEQAEIQNERVQGYREEILSRYAKTVLTAEVLPDPPVRGPYGYAHITLKDNAVPQREKPFKMHGEREKAHLQVTKDWLTHNYLEKPFTGRMEWLHQSFVVPKKSVDFPWRGVADMRGVNSQSKRVNYPLPRIEDLLIKQGGKLIYSIIDLKQAFHQQPLHPDCRHYTCTYTPLGVFQWRVNVMGLMNASQQFQQMMDDRLSSVSDIATPFIDDIIIGTWVPDGEDLYAAHLRDVHRVMEILEKDQFVADPKKCKFFVKEVEFCGHVLGGGTRRPAPGKLRAIERWELPQNISELRAFLGFTNYYSSYIEMYGEMVAPLQEMLKVPREIGKKGSKVKVQFSQEAMESFQKVKVTLCKKLLLLHVDPDKPFILRTDASRYAVGASLE